jgi:hypothetical protein
MYWTQTRGLWYSKMSVPGRVRGSRPIYNREMARTQGQMSWSNNSSQVSLFYYFYPCGCSFDWQWHARCCSQAYKSSHKDTHYRNTSECSLSSLSPSSERQRQRCRLQEGTVSDDIAAFAAATKVAGRGRTKTKVH